MKSVFLSVAGVMASAGFAHAAPVESVRLGVMAHNICVTDCDNSNKERGPNLNAQIDFSSPGFLKPVGAPRPYVMASVNLSGKTNFAAAGLEWTVQLGDDWTVQPGVGYAMHDGELDFPFPQGDPRNDPISADNVFLGSRDLFRSSLAIGRDLGEHWGAEVVYEHYSHGQILDEGRNQGMDMLGVRLRYQFGG
jgi:lipid A 3-O-deacylase